MIVMQLLMSKTTPDSKGTCMLAQVNIRCARICLLVTRVTMTNVTASRLRKAIYDILIALLVLPPLFRVGSRSVAAVPRQQDSEREAAFTTNFATDINSATPDSFTTIADKSNGTMTDYSSVRKPIGLQESAIYENNSILMLSITPMSVDVVRRDEAAISSSDYSSNVGGDSHSGVATDIKEDSNGSTWFATQFLKKQFLNPTTRTRSVVDSCIGVDDETCFSLQESLSSGLLHPLNQKLFFTLLSMIQIVMFVLALMWLCHMFPGPGPPPANIHQDSRSYRVPPAWGPNMEARYPFRRWADDLGMWAILTDMLPYQQCAAVIMRLEGGAKIMAKHLTSAEIMGGGIGSQGVHLAPVPYLLDGLQQRFGRFDEEIRLGAMMELMNFNRHSGESVQDLIA